jgi:cation transport ATPase
VADQLNLNAVKDDDRYRLKGQFEPAEDAEAKRQEDAKAAEHEHKRLERLIILSFALVMVFLFSALCVFLYLTGSVDDKKWSLATLASIISATLGYAFGSRKD